MSDPSPIPGDFWTLLASRQVNPLRVEANTEAPTQTQATTVFAFQYADGVMLAGDRRATAGNVIVTDRVDKVLELDSESLLAIAGVPAMAFEMARVLQTSFEYYRRSQLQGMTLPANVRALTGLLRENLPTAMKGVGIVVPLFAGLDHGEDPPCPRTYFYYALGA
jgi:proteasome beta subunit